MEPEEEDPRITIVVLRKLLAEKTAEVEKLKLPNSIAELAKIFSFNVQRLLGNFRETPQEIAGAAEIEAEMFPAELKKMENNGEPEAEDPGITIAVLCDLLAEKTAEVENLKERSRIAQIEQIAVLAKTFSFDVQILLGNFGETPEEIAGAAEIEAE